MLLIELTQQAQVYEFGENGFVLPFHVIFEIEFHSEIILSIKYCR